jgi:hypothetical protein
MNIIMYKNSSNVRELAAQIKLARKRRDEPTHGKEVRIFIARPAPNKRGVHNQVCLDKTQSISGPGLMIRDHEPGTCSLAASRRDDNQRRAVGRPALLQKYLKRSRCHKEA